MAISGTKDLSMVVVTDTHHLIEQIVELAISMTGRLLRQQSEIDEEDDVQSSLFIYTFDRMGGAPYKVSGPSNEPQFLSRAAHRKWLSEVLHRIETLNNHGLRFNSDGTGAGLMITVEIINPRKD